MRLCEGGEFLLVSLPEKRKKGKCLVRIKNKKFAQGKKTIAPPPHVSSGPPLSLRNCTIRQNLPVNNHGISIILGYYPDSRRIRSF